MAAAGSCTGAADWLAEDDDAKSDVCCGAFEALGSADDEDVVPRASAAGAADADVLALSLAPFVWSGGAS